MPQEDHSASKLNHPEEILWVVFPANDNATIIMEPSKQTLDFPAAAIATQRAAVLGDGIAPVPAVRRDQLHTEMLAYALVQRIAVVRLSPISRCGVSRRKRCWSVGSTSMASFGEALATCTARGRPWRSAIAMILLPLPRFVGPTPEPPFSPN